MSKLPKYQFDPYLLQLREEKETRARALAEAEEERVRQEDVLARLTERTAVLAADATRWRDEYDRLLRAAALTAQALGARRDHLRRLESDLAEARRVELRQSQVVANVRRLADESRVVLSAKAAEVRVHEERRERWLADLRREELRREQKQAEETAAALHERRRRDERG